MRLPMQLAQKDLVLQLNPLLSDAETKRTQSV
jgi:hypothetical protein